MEDAYILEAVRSPIGKFMGGMAALSAIDIASQVVKGLVSKFGDPISPDGLICGNVLSAGLGQNPAKQVVMSAGLKPTVPAFSVNMVCASGLKAVEIAANMVRTGDADIIIAGGMESMSNSPRIIRSSRGFRKTGDIGLPEFCKYSSGRDEDYKLIDEMVYDGLWDCYSDMHMGGLAEKIGRRYGISREEQDRFALESHHKAKSARSDGRFGGEIVGIKAGEDLISEDEGIRNDTSMEKLGELKPAFGDWTITAGNSSQLSDGAAFVVVASKRKADEMGIRPMAKVVSFADSGIEPEWYGLAPIDSVRKVLEKRGLDLNGIDLIEINEAFAVQTIAVARELGIDYSRLNVNGGAIALGHPIGASGARILTTLVHAMRRGKRRYGLASLCHGGGGSASMVLSLVE